MIGAVLKTVERASVPWVRIPPPPNLKATLKGGFFSELSLCVFYVSFVDYKNNFRMGCTLMSELVGSAFLGQLDILAQQHKVLGIGSCLILYF